MSIELIHGAPVEEVAETVVAVVASAVAVLAVADNDGGSHGQKAVAELKGLQCHPPPR